MADALKYRFGKVIDLPRPFPFDIFPNRELIQSGKGKGRAAPGAHATENLYSSFRVQSDISMFSTCMDAKVGPPFTGSRNDLKVRIVGRGTQLVNSGFKLKCGETSTRVNVKLLMCNSFISRKVLFF